MKPVFISLKYARQLAISSQYLNVQPPSCSKADVLKLIEHLGYVQIDTLSVVERAHHHTLWSRLPGYHSKWLNELLHDKQLFEYWGHAASILPMKDFRYSLLKKREYLKGRSHWFEQDKQIKRKVLSRIKREGPLQSKDFETPEKNKASWYLWKPAKKALEQLFMEGKLMVSHRQGFQKVYDLTENVLPAEVDTTMPSRAAFAEHLVKTAVSAQGIVTQKEMYYQRGAWDDDISKAIRKLLKEGAIAVYKLENHEQMKYYGPAELNIPAEENNIHFPCHFMSPFDNLLIQRRRLQRLFNFGYTIECYLPEHKRIYGYFTLPVLMGDRFIARIDPKADRPDKTLYIRNLAMEENVNVTDEMLIALSEKLVNFAAFNHCEKIVFEQCNQKKVRQQLRQLVKQQLQLKKSKRSPTT